MDRPSAAPLLPASPLAGAILGEALALEGTPYRDGGSNPRGFDCSGFVYYVFGRVGLVMPRTVAEQYAVGREIAAGLLQPGDLVFFATTSPGPSHVAIALGDGRFVHAPSSRGVVRIERLEARYWHDRFVAARRVLADTDSSPPAGKP